MKASAAGRVHQAFRQSQDAEPDLVSIAPGRVNLIGDHVDYVGGVVLPIAIQHNTAIAMGPVSDGNDWSVDFLDIDNGLNQTISAESQMDRTALDYIRGPIAQLLANNIEVPPLKMVVSSTVPMGAGLSSSAALQVAALLGMRAYVNTPTTPLELALEAQRSEHAIGTPCGLMDMYVSAAAKRDHACLIDCRHNHLEQVPLPSEHEVVFIITDTGVRHDLRDGSYAKRRAECEEASRLLGHALLSDAEFSELSTTPLPEKLNQRARHVLSENARVRTFASAMKQGDLKSAGQCMFESHRSLRTDFEVSCPELDLIVDLAGGMKDHGVHGSRMTGGGFGGCTITMCAPGIQEEFQAVVAREFQKRFDRKPLSMQSVPSNGAHLLES